MRNKETFTFEELEALFQKMEKLTSGIEFSKQIDLKYAFYPIISLMIFKLKNGIPDTAKPANPNQNYALFKAIVAVRHKKDSTPVETILDQLKLDLGLAPVGNPLLTIGLSYLLRGGSMEDVTHGVLDQLPKLNTMPKNFCLIERTN